MNEVTACLNEALIPHLCQVAMLLHELQIALKEDRCVTLRFAKGVDCYLIVLGAHWCNGVLMKYLVVLFEDLTKAERPIGHEMMWVEVYVMHGQSA